MRVRATATGFDGLTLRNPGDIFSVPDNVFEPRKRFENGVVGGKVIGEYPPPTWFEPIDAPGKGKPGRKAKQDDPPADDDTGDGAGGLA